MAKVKINNGDIQLEEYRRYVGVDSLKARAALEKLKCNDDAYLLACIALTYRDEGLFFKNGNRRKRIKQEIIKVAKRYIDRAFKLNPDCRDILYTKGSIYNAHGDTHAAIECYLRILEIGETLSAEFNCSGFDTPHAQMLVNDARFQLYRLFHDLENYSLSQKFLKAYKKELKKGVDTIYEPLEDFLMTN